MEINWTKHTERIKIFLINIPGTLQETFTWLLISYLIPLINIGIIWGIQQDDFKYDINVLSIVLVTNACFLTSLFYLAFSNKSDRKILNTISIAFYAITLTLFSISTIELVKEFDIFPLKVYQFGTVITLCISIILGLISKYDEQIAFSKVRAKNSRDKSNTNIGEKNVKI